jgi:hypothetical protein
MIGVLAVSLTFCTSANALADDCGDLLKAGSYADAVAACNAAFNNYASRVQSDASSLSMVTDGAMAAMDLEDQALAELHLPQTYPFSEADRVHRGAISQIELSRSLALASSEVPPEMFAQILDVERIIHSDDSIL